jgi:multidrug efflux pump subunit AcrA (membrane-fusion protein)
MKGFPRHIVIGTLAAFGALATGSCARPDATSVERAASDAPTVAAVKIGRGDIAQVLTIAAEFRPFQEIEVHAKVAGFLKSISVDVGDRVRAGQLLAVIEVPELQDEIRQDEAAVRRAAEEINRAQADLERARSAHDVAHIAADRLTNVMKVRPNLVSRSAAKRAGATAWPRHRWPRRRRPWRPPGTNSRSQRPRAARRKRCSTTRASRPRSPASLPIATPIPAR